jgi:hypothetical protein
MKVGEDRYLGLLYNPIVASKSEWIERSMTDIRRFVESPSIDGVLADVHESLTGMTKCLIGLGELDDWDICYDQSLV